MDVNGCGKNSQASQDGAPHGADLATLWVNPADWTIVDADAAALQLYELPREQMIGASFKGIHVAPNAALDEIMSPGFLDRARRVQAQRRLLDASVREVELTVSYWRHADQPIVCATARDVSGRVRADLPPISTDPILIVEDDRIADCNEPAAGLLGYAAPNELVGSHLADISPKSQPDGCNSFEKANALLARALSRGYQRFTWTHRGFRGEDVPVEVSLTAVTRNNKQALHCVWRDMTERAAREEAIRATELSLRTRIGYLEAQADASQDGMLVIGADNSRVLINRRLVEMLDIPDHVLADEDGRTFLEFLVQSVKNPEEFIERIQYLHHHADMVGRDEVEFKNGLIVDRRSMPILDREGKAGGRVWTYRDITEQKRAEHLLRLHYTSAEQNIASVVITDRDRNVIYANPKFTETTGLTRSEVEGKNLGSLRTQNGEIAAFNEHWEAASNLKQRFGDYMAVGESGDERWFFVVTTPLRDDSGQVTNYVWLMDDVTEQKRAIEQIRRQSSFIGSLLDSIPDIVFFRNSRGVHHEFNAQFAEFVGKPKEEILGRKIHELFDKDSADAYAERDRSVLESGLPRHEEEWVTYADGRRFLMDSLRTPYYDPDGELVGVLAICRDVTERRATEEELRKQYDLIRALLDNLPIGFAINTMNDGKAVYVSRNFEEIYGVAPGTIRSVEDFFNNVFTDPVVRERARNVVHEAIANGLSSGGRWQDITIRTAAGQPRVISAISIPLPSQNLMISTVQDVTEYRSMQLQLSQAQKLESIGQLAAGIAHEINTPTQYVADNTRFLKDAWAGVARLIDQTEGLLGFLEQSEEGRAKAQTLRALCQAEDLDYLSEQVPMAIDQSLEGLNRIAQIVKAMKDFSHPDTDTMSPVDLNAAIESTTSVSRNEWKYVAEMKLNLQPDLPAVPCFAGEFNQVLLNLIVNAAHAIGDSVRDTARKGVISITTSRTDDGMAKVSVSDTGTGIPVSAQSRLFDPFFTTKEVGKGTGQGLAIARNVIVNHHGGKIDFVTEQGVGTTFTILLPISQSDKDEHSAAA